ncbi:hypothetical protein SAMN03080617_02799 [Algoriphagus alkaliphilus]|uniref:Uncharacterized protein n=1 Tax=Algoriphagus alkaliphilus TaxID=279824 RepID=A0A1G5YU20_9BACT|nr:hypothetical protein [Algoriphagus alkaliphilus]MBA4301351.1 hypothetical protein [Cyclobacterium sp.]SDA85537.1 hypothetical protein SAMN03080617_02799 [Algoriphagus alkaliphilus]
MSSFLDDLFKKVFKPSDKSPMRLKENFLIKELEQTDLDLWIESEESAQLFALVYKNYHFKRTGINGQPQVHIFDSPYANGFAVTYENPFNAKSFSRLFLAFSQRLLALGYEQVSLDRKFEEINDRVKVTEKFYFKPPIQLPAEGELISQLYGNVSLEKVTIDNEPSYIKLLATVYSDRLYQDAKSFDQLMDGIFEKY